MNRIILLASSLLIAASTFTPAQPPSPDSIISGAGGDRFGYRIVSGDLNGDGRTDLAVSAPHQTGGNTVYVFFNLESFATNPELGIGKADAVIQGPRSSETGWSLAVGDVLGSRTDDLIIGAPVYTGRDGAVHVFAGPLQPGTYDTTTDATLTVQGHRSGYAGWDAAAGDFDGDGKDELAIGAATVGLGGEGEAYLLDVDGPTPPTDTSMATTTFLGVGITGASMANGGDINRDGYEDFLLGSYGSSITSGFGFGGTVHVVYGRASFRPSYRLTDPAQTGIANLNGEYFGANVGYDIEPAGDVDGDGFDDFMIEAPGHLSQKGENGIAAGRAYLILGARDISGLPQIFGNHRVSKVADIMFLGPAVFDRVGLSVGAAGFAGTTYSRIRSIVSSLPTHGPVLLIGTGVDEAYAYAYQKPQYIKTYKLSPPSVPAQRRGLVVDLGIPRLGLTTFTGPVGSAFGMEVHGPGDLDGDGINEIAFGATYQLGYLDNPGNGQVHLFKGK